MNKKLIVALVALIAVIGLMVGIWFADRSTPAPDGGNTQAPSGSTAAPTEAGVHFTVIVVHMDGSEKTFEFTTEKTHLGPALVAEGLIEEAPSPGMYDTVDGVKADWNVDQSWWSFYIGEEMATVGMDDTPVTEGAVYKLVHTK